MIMFLEKYARETFDWEKTQLGTQRYIEYTNTKNHSKYWRHPLSLTQEYCS